MFLEPCLDLSLTITASDLEFVCDAFRLAQAIFICLSGDVYGGARTATSVGPRIRYIKANNTTQLLLGGIFEYEKIKKENKNHWCDKQAELCAAVNRQFAEHIDHILKKIHQWGGVPVPPPQGGINFVDGYWYLGQDGVSQQRPKSPKNRCYTTVPVSLSFKPNEEDVIEIIMFVTTTFAGKPGALRMVLAMLALAAAGKNQPDKMIVHAGPGTDGKTLFWLYLLAAFWGRSHGVCPCSTSGCRGDEEAGHQLLGDGLAGV